MGLHLGFTRRNSFYRSIQESYGVLSDANKKLSYDRRRNAESDDFEDLEFRRRRGNPDDQFSFKEGGRHFYYKDVR